MKPDLSFIDKESIVIPYSTRTLYFEQKEKEQLK